MAEGSSRGSPKKVPPLEIDLIPPRMFDIPLARFKSPTLAVELGVSAVVTLTFLLLRGLLLWLVGLEIPIVTLSVPVLVLFLRQKTSVTCSAPFTVLEEAFGVRPPMHSLHSTALLFAGSVIATLMIRVSGLPLEHFAATPICELSQRQVFLAECVCTALGGLGFNMLPTLLEKKMKSEHFATLIILPVLVAAGPVMGVAMNPTLCLALALVGTSPFPNWHSFVLGPCVGAAFTATFVALWRDPTVPPPKQALRNSLRKARVFGLGMVHMVRSKDRKWAKLAYDPAEIDDASTNQTIRVYFIRHGESEWNSVFNKGFGPSFLLRLFRSIVVESKLWFTRDSLFVDSPLNREGITQALELQETIETGTGSHFARLRGEAPGTVLVASNLRRAVGTLTLAMWARLNRTGEQIVIASSLQEVSRNIDTLSLAQHSELPPVSSLSHELGAKFDVARWFNVDANRGNKTLRSNGLIRMTEFANWAMEQQGADTFVVGGHSLYFRSFFQTFLPRDSDHPGKTRKMVNGGVVTFLLSRGQYQGTPAFRIDPASVEIVHGGFA